MIKFLIWSNQHGAWWAPGARGYTLDIAQAGRFARHQAEREVEGAGSWGPHASDGVPDEVMVLAPECRWDSPPPEPMSVGDVEQKIRRSAEIVAAAYGLAKTTPEDYARFLERALAGQDRSATCTQDVPVDHEDGSAAGQTA